MTDLNIPDLDLREVADILGEPPAKLLEKSRKGQFPNVLTLRRGHHRLWKSDFEAWLDGRWTQTTTKRPRLKRMPRSERVG